MAPKTSTAHPRPWIASYPDGVAWDVELDIRPVHEQVLAACAKNPSAVALDFLGGTTTFGDLASRIIAFAGALQRQFGIGKGSRVALMLPNTPFYPIAYYAVLRAGGTVVNCNPLYTVHELSHITASAGADVMITLDLQQIFEKAEALVKAAAPVIPVPLVTPGAQIAVAVAEAVADLAAPVGEEMSLAPVAPTGYRQLSPAGLTRGRRSNSTASPVPLPLGADPGPHPAPLPGTLDRRRRRGRIPRPVRTSPPVPGGFLTFGSGRDRPPEQSWRSACTSATWAGASRTTSCGSCSPPTGRSNSPRW